MTPLDGFLRRRLLGISPRETTVARRGFRADDAEVRQRLEQIGATFLAGYHAALEASPAGALGPRLDAIDRESRGFAFEGAAMGLALRDHLSPRRGALLAEFLRGPGAAHVYMVHVGVGWAMARLRLRVEETLRRLDPLLGWLAVDGYGFHEGYFHWRRSVRRRAVPGGLSGYARRAFDQGLGRSLWFVEGAGSETIRTTIGGFDPTRRADLWSGVGLASAYAGGVGREAISALRVAGEGYEDHLAQGAAFAAKARQRGGNPASNTEVACRVLCGMSAEEAAELTDASLVDLPVRNDVPAYEAWRGRIRQGFRAPRLVDHRAT